MFANDSLHRNRLHKLSYLARVLPVDDEKGPVKYLPTDKKLFFFINSYLSFRLGVKRCNDSDDYLHFRCREYFTDGLFYVFRDAGNIDNVEKKCFDTNRCHYRG